MTSDQEKDLFQQYGWAYDYVGREWVSPDGTKRIGLDLIMRLTEEPEGDLQLMRVIVECGARSNG